MIVMRPVLAASAVAALAVPLVGTAAPVAAAAQHDVITEEYDETEPFAAGEGPCVAWAGTFHEVRHGAYKLVSPPNGRGETHVNGSVDGAVEVVPDDSRQPSYAGTYREKVDAVVSGITDDGFGFERVSQYHLKPRLHGSDGSQIVLTLRGKVTVNGRGVVTVQRDVMECR